jgi:hypothetical protein
MGYGILRNGPFGLSEQFFGEASAIVDFVG